MLRRAFTLQSGVYLLSLLKEFSEFIRQFGDAIERLCYFMYHPYAFISVLLSIQILTHPYLEISLSLIFLEECAIARAGIQAFLDRFNHPVQQSTEPIPELALH
jgi:hypothetical protein